MLFGEYEFDCDVEATRTLHQMLADVPRCKCVACRNFDANKQAIWGRPKLKNLLADLGLENSSDFETSFVAPSENEALYTTKILVVGNSDVSLPDMPEVLPTSSEHKFAIAGGLELHALDHGVRCSFGRLESQLDTDIPRDKIHQIELHIFVPWSISDEMPSINPHLL